MKLYALRDRLIDYFLQPFAAPGDKEVMSSLAALINREGNNDPIAQAPHHFELWRLADINEETGKVTGEPEFIGDCSALIRASVRERAPTGQGPIPGAERQSQRTTRGPASPTSTDERRPEDATQAKDRQREATHQGVRGTDQRGATDEVSHHRGNN